MRIIMAPRKKVKKVFSRRLQTGWGACPTNSFWSFKDYARTEVDKKEVAKTIRKYVRDNFSKSNSKIMLEVPEWYVTSPYYVAATIEWKNIEREFPSKWNAKKLLKKFFDEMLKKGKEVIASKKENVEKVVIKKRTIAEIVQERTSDFIGEVEEILDMFYSGKSLDIKDYSLFNELKKIDAPYNMAKGVHDYYFPLKEEAKLLTSKKVPKDLEEAYSSWSAAKKRNYLKLLRLIVEDADKYMATKKAVRKVRISRPKSADKQIKNLKFLKDSAEYKLASIDPLNVIGAMRLYTFNSKSRIITEYVCLSAKGFEVKGSTLQHVDIEASRETKLRKPEDFLKIIMKQSPVKINKEWKSLTTKTSTPNARINKDTLLLRALNK